jgi:hypothetical protein
MSDDVEYADEHGFTLVGLGPFSTATGYLCCRHGCGGYREDGIMKPCPYPQTRKNGPKEEIDGCTSSR